MSADTKIDLLGMDFEQLVVFFQELGEKPFRARQLMRWIYQRGVNDFARMTDLSKSLRSRLNDDAVIRTPEMVTEQLSDDGTRKWLFKVAGGSVIETVFIPDGERGTLCVSSQVGCSLDCTFCATARQGFNRNLSAAEIVAQLWVAERALGRYENDLSERQVSNVVFMGMGEPCLNLKAVLPAIRIMLDDFGFGLSKRRVTVSTSGVVPMMDKLSTEVDVALAVSLHAPTDELRDLLVPLNKKYPIQALMAACDRYVDCRSQRFSITYEYVMLDKVNDSRSHAVDLARLLKNRAAKVNLIPFNPFPKVQYKRSSHARIEAFQQELSARGILATTRRTRGEDIDAACGQLAGQVQDRTHRDRKTFAVAGAVQQ